MSNVSVVTVSVVCKQWLSKHDDECGSWCNGDREVHYCNFEGVVEVEKLDEPNCYYYECPECGAGSFVTTDKMW